MEIDFGLKRNLKYMFQFLSRKELRKLYAEKGVLGGTFLLLIMFVFVVISFPFMLIGAPFAALNQASKKWFKDNSKERES